MSLAAGLGALWGERRALEVLGEASFQDLRVAAIDGDIINNYDVATRS